MSQAGSILSNQDEIMFPSKGELIEDQKKTFRIVEGEDLRPIDEEVEHHNEDVLFENDDAMAPSSLDLNNEVPIF